MVEPTFKERGFHSMRLKDLLAGTDIRYLPSQEAISVSGIQHDSRKVIKGDMFLCFSGKGMDETAFSIEAAQKGAVVIISENPIKEFEIPVLMTSDSRKALSRIAANYYEHPSHNMKIFGVTGTNGKTTISYMLKSIVESYGYPCGIIGTIGYDLIDKKYDPVNTTPEATQLEKMLREMCNGGIKYCAMEVSSHGLQLSRTDDIRFEHVIFTNLTRDHLDFHGDMEMYYQAKKKLFLQSKSSAVINIDDIAGRRLYEELKCRREEALKIASYSMRDNKADFYGEIVDGTEKGSIMKVYCGGRFKGNLHIPIPGVFMAYNGLASMASCSMANLPFEKIESGIRILDKVPGRFEIIENHKNYLLIIDYAHTPDALEKVLRTVSDITKGRLICVFGCGGDRDREKRPIMGKVAGTYSDFCIITEDNPRKERQEEIAAQIEEGMYETDCAYEIINDREEAIKRAIYIYEKGDAILIAGKGHENYQIRGDTKKYFSDKRTVEKIMSEV